MRRSDSQQLDNGQPNFHIWSRGVVDTNSGFGNITATFHGYTRMGITRNIYRKKSGLQLKLYDKMGHFGEG
jgi:hypothetical protein